MGNFMRGIQILHSQGVKALSVKIFSDRNTWVWALIVPLSSCIYMQVTFSKIEIKHRENERQILGPNKKY